MASASTCVVARLPRPATPWSTLRAAVVGESLRALHDGFGAAPFAERAWGPAARAVRAAADGRLHERLQLQLAGVGLNPGGVVPADPRAGVAWPALAADPRLQNLAADPRLRPATGIPTRDRRMDRDGNRHRPRGFAVGGCACRESVVAVVDGALADTDPSSFLDVDADPPEPDERAAATALALLARAPRAHECDVNGTRFAKLLGRALWTLRLRRAEFAVGECERKRECACAYERECECAHSHAHSYAHSYTHSHAHSHAHAHLRGSSSLGDADAALAIRLEACEGAVMDAGEQWEPREAASAAMDVAAAAAGAAKAAGRRVDNDENDDGKDEATRARRAMLRRARDCVERCLVAVGILERLEGDG